MHQDPQLRRVTLRLRAPHTGTIALHSAASQSIQPAVHDPKTAMPRC